MDQKNFIRQKLDSGAPVFGIWSILNSPWITEIIATAGMDFQILDMEHGVYDLTSLDAGIRTSESLGCSPLVRVAGIHPSSVQSCLDLGAHGVIFPQVQGFSSANEAMRTTKFSPAGIRGFNPFTRAGGFQGALTPKLGNAFGFNSIIIENKKAYDELDQILEIPELDMIYLGVYDMSVALGCMGQMNNPAIVNFVETSIPKIRKAGKAVGVMAKTQEEMSRFLQLGANFLVFGVDSFVIHGAMKEAVRSFTNCKEQVLSKGSR